MSILVLGLILFLGIHSVRIFAPEWRERQRAKMGEGPWQGLYSLISAFGLILVIWGFAVARETTGYLYEPPIWARHLALLLMLFSLISIMVYSFPSGRLKPLLKHPMLLAVKIWAVAHLLANGETASVLLFGSMLVWAVLDRISVKRRGAAVASPGPVKWDIAAIVSAIVLYALFVWKLHFWLIGVQPM